MRTSPFIKAESDKSNFLLKRSKHVGDVVHETVTDLFPNSHDIPHSIRFYVSFIYVVVVVVFFIYLFYTGYLSTLDTQFLSPFSGGGNPSSNCELVPVTYSGNYLATQGGSWEGSAGFKYAEVTYQLAIISHTSTVEEYHTVLNRLFAGLQSYGTASLNQDLGGNLLLWMSLVFVNATSNAQRFTLVGSPLTIFDRDHTDGVVSSVHGNCNVTSTTTFDTSSGLMSMSFDYAAYTSNSLCMKALDPVLFGYNTLTNPTLFTLSYDIRTLITGLAANLHILAIEQLEEIVASRQSVIVSGVEIKVRSYYDPKYAGMKPILCVLINNAESSCVMQLGNVLAFPIFNHVGANLTSPELCNCSSFTPQALADKTHNCNVFRFLSGLVYVNNIQDVAYMFALRSKMGSAHAVNQGAHQAMFIAGSYGKNSPIARQLNSPASLEAAYDFCNVDNQTCSVLTFTSYDITAANWAVSEYYYQLNNGACRDSISSTVHNWSKLYNEPYAPLNQKYQQCSNDEFQTAVNQAGIAIGNVQIVAPICIILLLLLTNLHKWWHKVPLDESYSKGEKDSALDAYAMSLLLARDAHLKTVSFHNKESIITQIVAELSEHTMLSDMSHKNHQHQHHVLGAEREVRIYAKISALNPLMHNSGGVHSPGAVVPSESQVDTPNGARGHSPSGKYRTYDEEQLEQVELMVMQSSDSQSRTSVKVFELEEEEEEEGFASRDVSRKPPSGE